MSKIFTVWSDYISSEKAAAAAAAGRPGQKGEKGEIGPEGPAGSGSGGSGEKGNKGEPGANGADGTAGVKGEPGTNGADGAAGVKGEPGTNGTDGAVGQKGEPGAAGVNGALGFSIITASFDASAGNSFDWATHGISMLGVSNVIRESEGVFKVVFETALSSNNYTAVASAGSGNHTSSARSVSIDERTAESCTIRVERTDTGSQQDEAYVAVIILGV